jgi:hypothetical protein
MKRKGMVLEPPDSRRLRVLGNCCPYPNCVYWSLEGDSAPAAASNQVEEFMCGRPYRQTCWPSRNRELRVCDVALRRFVRDNTLLEPILPSCAN